MAVASKKLGAAIFGAGWVAGQHAQAYQRGAHTRLVAVGSRRLESAKACAAAAGAGDAFITTSFDEILARPDVDIVSITAPHDLHPDLTIRAARAGKHVCIEKPIGLDWKSCLEMQLAVREAGVKSIVAFCLHWNPSLINTRNLIEKGAIGKPYYVEVDYWHGMKKSYPPYPWAVTKAQGGSSLLVGGCHAVDAMRWLMGADNEIEEVTSYQLQHQGDNKDWEYDPTALLICRFKSGALGKVSSILDCKMPYAFNVDVVGTGGTIRDNRIYSESLFPGQTGWNHLAASAPDSGDVSHHPFDHQMEAIADSILTNRSCLPDLDDAIKTHEVIFAADLSASTRRPVKLPLAREL